jgi:type IV fimbrial biogenesis protein FimT
MSSQKGFTLIELMISLGILAILATMAVPSFQGVIEKNRVTSQANALLSAVQTARSEAVRRGVAVGFSAIGGDYDDGWCVHTGNNCATGTILSQGDTRDGIDFGGTTTFIFDARGQRETPDFGTSGAEASFTMEPADCATGTPNRQRSLQIGIGGRSMVVRGACS